MPAPITATSASTVPPAAGCCGACRPSNQIGNGFMPYRSLPASVPTAPACPRGDNLPPVPVGTTFRMSPWGQPSACPRGDNLPRVPVGTTFRVSPWGQPSACPRGDNLPRVPVGTTFRLSPWGQPSACPRGDNLPRVPVGTTFRLSPWGQPSACPRGDNLPRVPVGTPPLEPLSRRHCSPERAEPAPPWSG